MKGLGAQESLQKSNCGKKFWAKPHLALPSSCKSVRGTHFPATMPDRHKGPFTMRLRIALLAGLSIALSACTTTPSIATKSPVETRWVGQSAGIFFAKFGPPLSDVSNGSSTTYTWRGGYKKAKIPAKYEEKDGKRGRQISPARSASLSCTVQLTVDSSYKISSIRTVSDRPGVNGPSYCAEFLASE